MTSPPNKIKSCLGLVLALGGIGTVVLGIAIGAAVWQVKQREKHETEKEAASNAFVRFVGAKEPPAGAKDDAKARYRHGHVLIINTETGQPDEMFYKLPTDLRAANGDDVGTEVWVHWIEQVLGTYKNGGLMVKSDCDITVYDVSRNAVVAREHFTGEDPPLNITIPRGSKEGWEKLPTDEVTKFLQSLSAR
jgi:hypothetical protein